MAKEVKRNNKTQKKSPKNKVEKKEVVETSDIIKEQEEVKSKNVKKEKIKTKKEEKEPKKYSIFQTSLVMLLVFGLLALSGYTAYKEISAYFDKKKVMDEFYETFESEELQVIFYSATGCSFCELEKPILDQIAKDYKFEYLEIDYTKLTEKQHKEIMDKLGVDGATPVTLIVRNGKVKSKQVGYVDGYKYVQFFVKSEFLPEGSTYIPERYLTFINYDEFKEISKSKEPQVVAIGGARCEYCNIAKPMLSNLSNAYNIKINYITLDYFTADERLLLTEDLEELEYDEETFVKSSQFNTPTVLIINDGKVVDYIVGLSDFTSYTKLFKDNKIIKK